MEHRLGCRYGVAQIQHCHHVVLIKVSLVVGFEVVALADLVHDIVLTTQTFIHRELVADAFGDPSSLTLIWVSIDLFEWIVMFNHLRRPSYLLTKGGYDWIKAFEQAIFCHSVIIELALLIYFLADPASTLINEFIRREEVLVAFRVSLEADWVLRSML